MEQVIIIKSGALATSPRTTLRFVKGDKYSLGDQGLTEANLERLVELDYGEFTESIDDELLDYGKIEDDSSEVDYYTDKISLEQFARDTYGIELDRRKSLAKMKKDLKSKIKGE